MLKSYKIEIHALIFAKDSEEAQAILIENLAWQIEAEDKLFEEYDSREATVKTSAKVTEQSHA